MDRANLQMTPQAYRQLFKKNYLETRESANQIKKNFKQNHDPICQKEDRYIPPKTRSRVMPIKRKEEKPYLPKKKQIIVRGNFGSGPNVITEEPKRRGIRMNSAQRRNDESFQRRVLGSNEKRKAKGTNEYSIKNFYQDYSNTVKPNFNDKYIAKRKNVSFLKLIIYNYIFHLLQKANKPKIREEIDLLGIPPRHLKNKEGKINREKYLNQTGFDFQRPPAESTRERLFSSSSIEIKNNRPKKKVYRALYASDSIGKIFDSIGKRTKMNPVSNKISDGNYKLLSTEAKKNLNNRYYYDKNYSNW